MKKIESYDKEAKKWSSLMIDEKKYAHSQRFLLELIKKYKKKTMIDIGCGSGLYSIFFAKMGLNVTGIDISKNMIKECKKNARGVMKVNFFCSDMNKFKVKKKFGVVLSSSSLHNMRLPTLLKSLKSLINMLEKEGILAIVMRLGNFEGLRVGHSDIKRYYRYSNPREIKRFLKKYDLVWEKTHYAISHKNPYFIIIFRNSY